MLLPPRKPLTKLFKCVSQIEYVGALSRLAEMRSAYPGFSDEELLLRLYCDSENYIRIAKWRAHTLSRVAGG